MFAVEIKFTARQYHATPWDAHTNEGRVEWPPCPWRIARALVAVGYSKLNWHGDIPDVAKSLLTSICNVTPKFILPNSAETHTRHYMPVREGKNQKTVKIIDSFLRIANDDDPLWVIYECELEDPERKLLNELIDGLAYLGRAESWVEARLLESVEMKSLLGDSDPKSSSSGKQFKWSTVTDTTSTGTTPDTTHGTVRLLAPCVPRVFDTWRQQAIDSAVEAKLEIARGESGDLKEAAQKKIIKKVVQPYPADMFEALKADNIVWQKNGWPHPPGSRWVDYSLPPNLFQTTLAISKRLNSSSEPPKAILLSIDGAGESGNVRPLLQRSLPLMEMLHAYAINLAAKRAEPGSNLPSVITGKDHYNKPLKGSHNHAHWIPLSLYGKGQIDHVLVFSNSGFCTPSREAISAITHGYAKGISKLAINVVGVGSISDVYRELSAVGGLFETSTSVLKSGTVFESFTPLVLRKYLSNRGKKTCEGQIREELKERGIQDPLRIETISSSQMVERKLKGFILRRKSGKPQPMAERSWAFRIHFAEPVINVPITLGYGSHFGLGLFHAVK